MLRFAINCRRIAPVMRRATAAGLAVLTVAPAVALADPAATIRRTEHGIPHVLARDWEGLAYGYGYALAQDNVCVLADSYVTVRAERSRYFGPGATYPFRSNSTNPNNLNSDFFYKRIIDRKIVEKLLGQSPPLGPRPEIKQGVRGYVAGYNRYLRDTGVDNIPDPACRGKPWVKPIEEIDAYRRFYQLALLASSGVAIDGIGGAQPLVTLAAGGEQPRSLTEVDPGRFEELLGGIGSNAVALGKEATDDGRGMLLGNPHFPWDGSERFYQSHLTIPGKVDVQGGSLFGVPLVLIGFTRGMAWSHTVSTARRFTIYDLKLVPGSPTTYLVDGQPRQMTETEVTVQALTSDGRLEPRSRTLYDTEYGQVLTSILGLPVFPWTPLQAYAMGDVNAGNFRYLNHFFEVNQAQSVGDVDSILKRNLGIPWVNTIAADKDGKAYYADIGAMPNVSNAKIADCSTPLGVAANQALRVQVLDGTRSSCKWDTDRDAVAPGIFGPRNMPSLTRDDYVSNMNDSYWLTNPKQPIEGYSRVIGDERTARALRTRLGLRIIQQRLDGSDGLPGNRFTLEQLKDAVFNNRQYAGELWRDQLVSMCKGQPMMWGSSGPVDVSGACTVLERWDLHDNLDSRGALLFRRFASRALSSGVSSAVPPPISPFSTPFSASDPVNTPRGLNTGSPQVSQALADAVSDLNNAGIPLDAPLRDHQYERRGEERIPIHGGPGGVGVFNAINVGWDAAAGHPNIPHGSSYVQTVSLDGGCPKARTILTYSQSTSPESPWFADQTRMFSRKEWVTPRFCEADILKSPVLRILRLNGGADGKLIRSLKLVRRTFGGRRLRSLVLRVRVGRAAKVSVALLRGKKVVKRVKAFRPKPGRTRQVKIRARGVRRGAYRLRVTVSDATERKVKTFKVRRT